MIYKIICDEVALNYVHKCHNVVYGKVDIRPW